MYSLATSLHLSIKFSLDTITRKFQPHSVECCMIGVFYRKFVFVCCDAKKFLIKK